MIELSLIKYFVFRIFTNIQKACVAVGCLNDLVRTDSVDGSTMIRKMSDDVRLLRYWVMLITNFLLREETTCAVLYPQSTGINVTLIIRLQTCYSVKIVIRI